MRRGKPYPIELRERVVASVLQEGLSRNQAAKRFGVGISTAVNWVRRFLATGSVAPSKIGGYRQKTIRGAHREWLLERMKEKDFTLRGLVAELAAERGLKVDYKTMWSFVHGEKLSLKKASSPASDNGLTWRAGGRGGSDIRGGSPASGLSSSMRPGPRPTWRPCAAGACAAKD